MEDIDKIRIYKAYHSCNMCIYYDKGKNWVVSGSNISRPQKNDLLKLGLPIPILKR